jgi:hypothetical protein
MTSPLQKIKDIHFQGLRKIGEMFRSMCLENEHFMKKLEGTKEEKEEARGELLGFADLLTEEIKKLSLEKGKSQEEIISQMIKEEHFTEKETEEIQLLYQLIEYCRQTSFQNSKTINKKIEKIKA